MTMALACVAMVVHKVAFLRKRCSLVGIMFMGFGGFIV
jgi:hypothetical protein